MNTHYRFSHRLLAMVLAFVLVLGMAPKTAFTATAVEYETKVADPSTLNGWQKYFGTAAQAMNGRVDTEYAGGVWTDKSVFTDASAFSGVTLTDESNFLVALSAIAANESVSGQAESPVDTMLVLDLSNSMDNSRSIPDMVEAANEAIKALLDMNPNSRVGVVLYSGNSQLGDSTASTATTILPLARYTAVESQVNQGNNWNPNYVTVYEYLEYTGSSNNTTVKVHDDLKYADGTDVANAQKTTEGGTYIQNGLYKAWQEFDSKIQSTADTMVNGAKRTPVVLLMSDGDPTVATTSYNNVGRSDQGNGGESSNTITFLTQLTAAWVKGKLSAEYGTDAMFYTLGVGSGLGANGTAVLYPQGSSNTLNNLWNSFLAGTPGTNVTAQSSNNGGGTSVTVYRDAAVTAKNYVDGYWYSETSGDMMDSFQQIVSEIQLQATYSVTLVEGGDENLSGYVSFEDQLGEFMEVKKIDGLQLGDKFFTGELFMDSLDNMTDAQGNPTEYGNEFVRTVRERLGIDTSTAQKLINDAFNDGQLGADAGDGVIRNYIGWYGDENNNFVGFWDKDYGLENAPAGAVYANKSYGYLGAESSQAGASDMMHVIVMVHTNISNGHQSVIYKIPASLLPTVSYTVRLSGSNLETVESVTRTGAEPLRLIFEVGLRSDINEVNLESKLQEALASGEHHVHENADGTYSFYTNRWGSGDGSHEIDYTEPNSHLVASSHFHPAQDNKRFYYTQDTLLYVASGSGYVPYESANTPVATTNDQFFFGRVYYTEAGQKITEYLGVTPETVAQAAANGIQEGNRWYIPAGTPILDYSRVHTEKTDNTTDTLRYSFHPTIMVDTSDEATANGYDMYEFLGNNGKLVVAPATGLQVTKNVTEAVDGAPTEFTFTVELSQAEAGLKVTDSDGVALTKGTDWNTTDNKTVTLTLADGESAVISGLTAGTTYTVTETGDALNYYTASATGQTGQLQAHTISQAVFTNSPIRYGDLVILKEVVHPFDQEPEALADVEFTFEVTLEGMAGKKVTVGGTETTVDANGKITGIVLTNDGSVTVSGIPAGTAYTVTETPAPGFGLDEELSSGMTGTIPADGRAEADVINRYPVVTEKDVSISLTVQKDVVGTYTGEEDFVFVLERLAEDGQTYVHVQDLTVSNGADPMRVVYDLILTLDDLGSHHFRLTEKTPAQPTPGMTYSAARGLFRVDVTDENMDGQLETSVVSEANMTVTGSGEHYDLSMTFTNTYAVNGTSVPVTVRKVLDNNTGVELTPVGYTFGFYLKNADGTVATEPSFVRTTGATGVAQLNIPITDAAQDGTVYVIREIVPDTRLPGMQYTTEEYELTISVTDNASQLEAVAVLSPAAADGAAVFTNTYRLASTELTLSGSKTLTGREPNGSEFTFQLTEMADGAFLTPKAGGIVDTQSVGKGTFSFDKITYTTVGTHYYQIQEIPGDAGGVTYDPARYHVTVVVAPEGDRLVATTHVTKVGTGVVVDASTAAAVTGLDFTNTYTLSGTASLELSGLKTLTGRRLNAGEFSFVLSEGGTPLATVANLPDGTFSFPAIVYDVSDLGDHTYTVSEVVGTLGGVTYDTDTYTFTVKVVDNGQGGLAVEGAANIPALTFENTYFAQPTTVTLSGDKLWTNTDTGADMTVADGDFTFRLYSSNEDFTEQGAEVGSGSTVNGRFSISKTYSHGQQGTYYYILREDIGSEETVTYDPAIYNVKIVVVDAGTGQLTTLTTIEKVGVSGQFTETDFHNYYTPAPAELTLYAKKELTGRDIVAGEFDFQLFETDSTFSIAGKQPIQTKANNGANATDVVFDPMAYENTGTYYYVLREFIPAGADTTNTYKGVTYDDTLYQITVTVEDQSGTLVATAKVNGAVTDAQNPVLFRNTYAASGSVSFSINGTKKLTGDRTQMQTGDFVFELYDANGIRLGRVPNQAGDGTVGFTFSNITFVPDSERTYTFTVKENAPAEGVLNGVHYDLQTYTVQVPVTHDNAGNWVAGAVQIVGASEIVFTNEYKAEDTTVTLRGNKELSGRRLQAGEFTMELIENGGVIQRATNTVLGGFVFQPITYTEEGTHTYIVREQIPVNAVNGVYKGVTYDTTEHTVTVKVEDNGMGQLEATVTYPTEGLAFHNSYAVAGSVGFSLEGTKTFVSNVTGQSVAMPTGTDAFTFRLTDTMGNVLATATAAADGSIRFTNPVPLTTLGQHTFLLQEVKGSLGGVSYDGKVYTVTVMTYDNGDGTMHAGAPTVTLEGHPAHISFSNTYSVTGPAVFDVEGTKAWLNITDPNAPQDMTLTGGEFTFELYEGAKKLATATNDAAGKFVFQDVELGTLGVHDLTVKEVLPTGGVKDGTTYDAAEYTVSVTVSDDGNGGMEANVSYPTTGLTVTNNYQVTGTAQTQIKGHKAMIGKTLNGNEFTFELYETDSTFAIADGQQPVDTQVNGGADHGSFAFELSYTPDQIGKHYYVVKEQAPDGGFKDGVSYDSRSFCVSVEVSDNGVGGLAVSEPVITLNGAPTELRFLNAYSITGVAHVDISGEKTLSGRKLTAGAFSFELYDEAGQLVETVTNAADGSFLFDDVPLTELGSYTYTVQEKAGDEKGMAYDDTVFQVEIRVSDNGVGGKKAEILSIKADGAAAELNFVNTYTPADITVGVAVKKTVKAKTEDTIGPDGFKFLLTDAQGKELSAVVSDKNGDAGFNLIYTVSDIGKTYTYLVKEANTRKTGVVYDTTVHTLTVAITADDKGDLVADVKVDGEDSAVLSFVNTYEKPVSPVTGDTFQPIVIGSVMVLSLTALVVLLIARRKKEQTAE